MADCFLCHSPLGKEKVNKLTARGIPALKAACAAKNRDAYEFLINLPGGTEVLFHEKCRKDICRHSRPASPEPGSAAAMLPSSRVLQQRSSQSDFDLWICCLFCSVPLPAGSAAAKYNVSSVTREVTKQHLMQICNDRDDEWGHAVRTRIINEPSLCKAGARYHKGCYADFYKTKRKCNLQESPGSVLSTPSPPPPGAKRPRRTSLGSCPLLSTPPPPTPVPFNTVVGPGRSLERERQQAFNALCEYLKSAEECQFTLKDLTAEMAKHTSDGSSYGEQSTLKLLRALHGKLIVTERPGRPTLLCFGEKAADIMCSSWHEQKRGSEVGERQRIVETAPAIIRDEIRRRAYATDEYPTVGEVEEGGWESLPRSLRTLLTEVICKGKKGNAAPHLLKCNMIGQAVVSAARPRSYISPVQHALAVYVHRTFGSKHLVDVLHCLGVCSSYTEANNYEKCVTEHAKPAITNTANTLLQFVFDNADFDISTIDGLNTFHVMGEIKCISPASNVSLEVPRCTGYQKVDVSPHGSITLSTYTPTESGFKKITVADLRPGDPLGAVTDPAVSRAAAVDRVNFLWLGGTVMQSLTVGWTGFQQMAHAASKPVEKTAIIPVPFINLEASNPTTINTALEFAVKESAAIDQQTTTATFDQPLFMKAEKKVLAAKPGSLLENVVVNLGGFRLLMSFMHAVCYFIAGSGLEEMWATIYAPKSVAHMMTAKAFSRAVRAHFLSQACIFDILCKRAEEIIAPLKNDIRSLFNEVVAGRTTFQTAPNDARLSKLVQKMTNFISELSSGRLAKLWLNYFNHVNIIRSFIFAQKTGDWDLHLSTIRDMLPIFHAAGHLNYAKAA